MRLILIAMCLLFVTVSVAPTASAGPVCSSALGVCLDPQVQDPEDIEQAVRNIIGPCTCPPRPDYW